MKHKMLMWCNNVMKDEELQTELESKVTALLEGPLKDRDEYAQEKCIKSFYEGLVYLESLLLKQNGIHPSDSEEIIMQIALIFLLIVGIATILSYVKDLIKESKAEKAKKILPRSGCFRQSDDCVHPMEYTCVKCGDCGRKFIK